MVDHAYISMVEHGVELVQETSSHGIGESRIVAETRLVQRLLPGVGADCRPYSDSAECKQQRETPVCGHLIKERLGKWKNIHDFGSILALTTF